MPIIKFKCGSCDEEFEDFRNIDDKHENGSCLTCGSGEIRRVEVLVADCDCGCGCAGHHIEEPAD